MQLSSKDTYLSDHYIKQKFQQMQEERLTGYLLLCRQNALDLDFCLNGSGKSDMLRSLKTMPIWYIKESLVHSSPYTLSAYFYCDETLSCPRITNAFNLSKPFDKSEIAISALPTSILATISKAAHPVRYHLWQARNLGSSFARCVGLSAQKTPPPVPTDDRFTP